ncbi:MAG: hypothetical protein L0H59_09310, partial [Tomitella sp.]|nr:hypothetical protein [Tomitella sp.]
LPRIRSERPAFELHYPHMVERMREEAHVGVGHGAKTNELVEADRHAPGRGGTATLERDE